jgi:hypothetical protein
MRHVGCGSKTDICSANCDVRFTPQSGHVRCNWGCPLWAIFGPMQCSNNPNENERPAPGGSRTQPASDFRDLAQPEIQERMSNGVAQGLLVVCAARRRSISLIARLMRSISICGNSPFRLGASWINWASQFFKSSRISLIRTRPVQCLGPILRKEPSIWDGQTDNDTDTIRIERLIDPHSGIQPTRMRLSANLWESNYDRHLHQGNSYADRIRPSVLGRAKLYLHEASQGGVWRLRWSRQPVSHCNMRASLWADHRLPTWYAATLPVVLLFWSQFYFGRLRVISGHLRCNRPCPLYPQ